MPYRDKEKAKLAHAQWYVAHRAESNAASTRWYAEHREEKRAYDAKRYAQNAEEVRLSARNRYHEHTQESNKASRKWRSEHIEEARATHAKYYAEHKEAALAYCTKWQHDHPQQRKAICAKWSREHPEQVRACTRRRRARKANAPVNDLTAQQWKALRAAYRNHCHYCQKESDDLTQDHMTPLSRGGAHTAKNIVPACRSCNAEKGTKTVQEYFDAVTGGW